MLKKLSALLGALMLTVGIGAVSASAADVLINEDFEGSNPGVFTAANQEGTDCEMYLVKEDVLTSGYTYKGQAFSEADIVEDEGDKALRLNLALQNTAAPMIASVAKLPTSGKAIAEFRMKVNHSSRAFFRYRNLDQNGHNLLRLDRAGVNIARVKYNTNTTTASQATITYGSYHNYKYIFDIDKNLYTFYIDDVLMAENVTPSGKVLSGNSIGFSLSRERDPVLTYSDEAQTDIASIKDDGFVFIDDIKLTTVEDTRLVKVTPAEGSADIAAPSAVTFEYNNAVTATAAAINGDAVDFSYEDDGKTIKINYAFENEKEYLVSVTGITDELGVAIPDAATDFTTKVWTTDDVVNPVKPAPENTNTYYINESFDTAAEGNITPSTPAGGWSWTATQTNVTIEDAALKFLPNSDFRIGVTKKTHPEVTVFDYDVFLGTGAKQLNIERLDGGFNALALWRYGYLDAAEHPDGSRIAGMTAGEWHNVRVVLTASKRDIYIDNKLAVSFNETADLANTYSYRFKLVSGNAEDENNFALIDDLKIYTISDNVVLTGVSPAFDAVDVSTAAQVEFTFSDTVDFANAVVTLNRQSVDATIKENNGKLVVTFDELLNKDTVYAVALSGVKTVLGNAVPMVETRFSTTLADEDSWYVSALSEGTVPDDAAMKNYSVTVRTTLENKTAQLIAATYDNSGKLVGVGFSEKTALTKDIAQEITAAAKFYSGCSVKCFLWEDIVSMVPVWGIIE